MRILKFILTLFTSIIIIKKSTNFIKKYAIKRELQNIKKNVSALLNNEVIFLKKEEYLFTNNAYEIKIIYGQIPITYTCFFPRTMPALKIETHQKNKEKKEIAYFQEITITTQTGQKTIFIDSNKTLPYYPFYTIDKTFIDIPLWDNQVIQKWEAKLFIFKKNNTKFTMIANIKWGFEYEKKTNQNKNLPLNFRFSKN